MDREEATKKAAEIAKCKSRIDNLNSDISELSDEVNFVAVEFWKDQEDILVSRTLKKVSNWEKLFEKISTSYRKVKEAIAVFNIKEDELAFSSLEYEFTSLSDDFRMVKEAVIEEDRRRELYTLDAPATLAGSVKFPTFGGTEGEDYLDFKEKIEKAFVRSRITQADKLTKLRECLRGDALGLVPLSLTGSIEHAWLVLDKAYGDVIHLIRFKKEQLLKLGRHPKSNGKGGSN